MTTKERTSPASFGSWSLKLDQNQQPYIRGYFKGDTSSPATNHWGYAKRTMGLLRDEGIIPQNRELSKENGGYAVYVLKSKGDSLQAFEDWAAKQKLSIQRPAVIPDVAEPKWVEQAILRNVTWEGVDVPGMNTIVGIATEPEIALQVAHYLKRDGYIDEATHKRVSLDTAQAKTSGQDEFRIMLLPERTESFRIRFPQAGQHMDQSIPFTKRLQDGAPDDNDPTPVSPGRRLR